MFRLLQLRDKKEREIAITKEQILINKEQTIRNENNLEQQYKNYKQWLLDNDLEAFKISFQNDK
jgi:hypothetical protein